MVQTRDYRITVPIFTAFLIPVYKSSIVIAATNQRDMMDDALLRRFDNKALATKIAKEAQGLSYYSIQKTLITAIKRSLFAQ